MDKYILGTRDKYLDSDLAIDLKVEMLGKLLQGQQRAKAPQSGLPAAAQALAADKAQTP